VSRLLPLTTTAQPGNAGWDNVFLLPGDGTLPTDQLPVLHEEERLWLAACFRATVQRKPG
jgi:hypothetical protein